MVMPNSEYLPAIRPLSHGSLHVSRKLQRAELATAEDVALADLDMWRRRTKAEREIRANRAVVSAVTEAEFGYYDDQLPETGTSLVKQRSLANRMERLVALNDDTLDRFSR